MKRILKLEVFIHLKYFLFINNSYKSNESEIIPDNTFMTIYCDSFEREKEFADILFRYIEEEKYKIAGDYICEVIVELPIVASNERNMLIKLQVPVKNCLTLLRL